MLVKRPWAVPMLLMKPDDGTGGAGGGGEGGDPGGGDPGGGNPGDKTKDFVPLTTHKEALQKMHEANNTLKALQAKVDKMESDAASASRQAAEGKGDFKNLYEQSKAETETWKKKYSDFQTTVINDRRINALEGELKKMGLKQGAESVIDFVDLEKMPHELTSKGRILVHGVEEMAQDIRNRFEYAFGKPATPKINTGGGNNRVNEDDRHTDTIPDSELTAAVMIELETKDPKKYREVYPRYLRLWKERSQRP